MKDLAGARNLEVEHLNELFKTQLCKVEQRTPQLRMKETSLVKCSDALSVLSGSGRV